MASGITGKHGQLSLGFAEDMRKLCFKIERKVMIQNVQLQPPFTKPALHFLCRTTGCYKMISWLFST